MVEKMEEENSRVKRGKEIFNILRSKKVILSFIAIALIIILFFSSSVRFSNWELLNDKTTGEKVPLALDPYYFLRMAETKMSSIGGKGKLPEEDNLRYPAAKIGWHEEILPEAMIFMYKTAKIFQPDITFREVNVASPVIFFLLGMVAFFFLILFLTNSKVISLLSTGFLGFIPMFLHRTMAGFSDHEAIGMFAFLLTLAVFTLGMKFLDRQVDKEKDNEFNKKTLGETIGLGIATGIASGFTIMSWTGIANFIFMILPFAFFIFWIIKNKEEMKLRFLPIIFYIFWIATTLVLPILGRFGSSKVLNSYLLDANSLLVPAVLGFIVLDLIVHTVVKKWNLLKGKENKRQYDIAITGGILVVLGTVFLILQGELIQTINRVFFKLFNPFGGGRVGETVAENRSPGINTWFSNIGKIFFWAFYLGMVMVGINVARGIRRINNKIGFSVLWVILLSGIIFSTNIPFEKFFYFASLIIFLLYFVWLYFNDEINIKTETIIIVSWLIFMIIAGRGAVRLFFVLSPFVAFMGGYLVVSLFQYSKEAKEEVSKVILWLLTAVIAVILLISFMGFIPAVKNQAENSVPSSGKQWQEAMSWMRTNTSEDSTVLHWWDYGYWTETLGERAAVADGGHVEGSYQDHLIGRYVLTTPKAESALTYMKSHNVSHLIIDPTDLGKYGAYSRIGSGPNMKDRKSQIPVMKKSPEQTRETANNTIRVYQGAGRVDEDIVYSKPNGKEIFLPRNKAYVAGVIIKTTKEKKEMKIGNKTQTYTQRKFLQPKGVFVYNQKRYRIPLNNLYYNGEMKNFSGGINSTFRIIPRFTGKGIDTLGGGIYLSPKVSKSLFAQLYLMDDPYNKYSSLEVAHKQPSSIIKSINMQSKRNIGDFLIYKGFRGPLKIWNASYPENIERMPELTEKDKGNRKYGEYDDVFY